MTSRLSHRARTGAWLVVLALALLLAARTVVLIHDMVRPMPFWDAWEFMKALPAIFDGRYGPRDVFGFHNEHRIVTTRLLMLVDLRFFAASGYFLTAVLTVLLCLIGYLLAGVTVGASLEGAAAAAVATGLLLSVAQYENFASGFQIQFPLVDLSAIAAIGLFARACRSRHPWWWTGGAILADAVAVGSMASGNLVLGAVLLVALALRARIAQVLVFTAASLAMTGAYLVGYPKPEAPPSHDPVAIAHFVVDYLGSALRGIPGASLWLGLGLLAAYTAMLVVLARAWWRREPLDAVLVWLAGIAAFAVAGAVVTATGRLALGIETATSSRYAIQSLLFACCVFLMGWRLAGALPARGGVRLGLASACLAVSAASTMAAAPLGEWRDRVATYDAAGMAFASGVFSDDFVQGVYPRPDLVQGALAFLARHRLGPFSEDYAGLYRPPTNALATQDIGALPACDGAQDAVRTVAPHWREIDGWAVATDRPAEGGWVMAYEPAGRLLGFARQTIARPDVAQVMRVAVSRTGYHLGLNMPDDAAAKPVTIVLVPNGIVGAPCRVATAEAAAR